MFVPLPLLIIGAIAMLGLLAWALLRTEGDRRRDLVGPPQSISDRARAAGFDDAAATRIAARGGDDRYEMPGVSPAIAEPVSGLDGSFVDLSDELRAEIWRLVHTGHKINAIKLVRERTGLGLKESKDFVEGLRQSDATLR